MRVTSGSWNGETLILRDRVLGVRNANWTVGSILPAN
jgi:hypothetical protein